MNHQDKLRQGQIVWKRRIEEFKKSNLSPTDYAKSINVTVHQFYYWRAKFIESENTNPAILNEKSSPSPLIKVIHPPAQKKSSIDPKWLAQLIKELYEIS